MDEGKVYTDRALNAGTYLGGPLVAGYMLAENFKLFKQDDHSRNIIFGSVIFFILFFELILMLPQSISDEIPDIFYPLIYSAIGYGIYVSFQKKKIEDFINAGGSKQSAWKITGITLLGGIITFAYILLRLSFIAPFDGKVMEFGKSKHQIYYSESINVKDVNIVGMALTSFGYFQAEEQQIVNLTNSDSSYHLYIYVIRDWWEDSAIIESLQSLEGTINMMGLEYPLKIMMYEDTFSGRKEKVLPDTDLSSSGDQEI